MIGQVCEGLDATHRIGVIHRDLKPGNIFVCSDRSSPSWVKLLDFGVAKLADVELASDPRGMSAPHTAEGAVLGTPAYMSPEQAVGEELDARSDVYAIGTILYELVCGTPPFVAKRFVDYVHKHAAETPRPITEHDTGRHAPAALEAVISRCLEKRPERRYPGRDRTARCPRGRSAFAGQRWAAATAPFALVDCVCGARARWHRLRRVHAGIERTRSTGDAGDGTGPRAVGERARIV